MKHFWLACLAVILPQLSVAQEYRCNQHNKRCGDEYYDQTEHRFAPPVSQPIGTPIQTPCGGQTPHSQSYRASLNAVTCGEGAEGRDRLPLPVEKPVLDRWEVLRGGQRTDAREVMQEIRQQNIQWRGTLEFPMWESWSYQEKVGGFNTYRCGSESYITTCSRSLERLEITHRRVEDTSNCLEYEEIADEQPAATGGSYGGSYGGSSGTGSGSSGSTYTPPSGFDNRGSSAPTGSGESSRELEKKSEDRMNRHPDSTMNLFNEPKRGLARQGRCLRYGTKEVTDRNWVSDGTVTYSCTKQRGRYCEWFEGRTVSRRCQNHKADYILEFAHDPNWKPDMRVSRNPLENYNDLLPNKFDLLPGEAEDVYVYSNSGVSTALRPSMKIENKWNNYHFEIAAKDLQCRPGMQPKIRYRVHTLSRIKRKAPNPLALPRDEKGNKISPFKYAARKDGKGRTLMGKPVSIMLQDNSRATILAASEITRTFPSADNAMKGNTGTDAIRKRKVDTSAYGTALTNGFWADTQFKIRMIRLDKWGREVRMTEELTMSNAKEMDVFGETVTIDLQGKNGRKAFYRPATLLAPILGSLKSKKDIELSPGKEYIMKLQVVQRGLPWYESGCKNGKATCEGETADAKAFSEPVLVKFKYDENAKRSLSQWLHDVREFFMIF